MWPCASRWARSRVTHSRQVAASTPGGTASARVPSSAAVRSGGAASRTAARSARCRVQGGQVEQGALGAEGGAVEPEQERRGRRVAGAVDEAPVERGEGGLARRGQRDDRLHRGVVGGTGVQQLRHAVQQLPRAQAVERATRPGPDRRGVARVRLLAPADLDALFSTTASSVVTAPLTTASPSPHAAATTTSSRRPVVGSRMRAAGSSYAAGSAAAGRSASARMRSPIPAAANARYAAVVGTKPAGTGRPARVSSPRLPPCRPPRRRRRARGRRTGGCSASPECGPAAPGRTVSPRRSRPGRPRPPRRSAAGPPRAPRAAGRPGGRCAWRSSRSSCSSPRPPRR